MYKFSAYYIFQLFNFPSLHVIKVRGEISSAYWLRLKHGGVHKAGGNSVSPSECGEGNEYLPLTLSAAAKTHLNCLHALHHFPSRKQEPANQEQKSKVPLKIWDDAAGGK